MCSHFAFAATQPARTGPPQWRCSRRQQRDWPATRSCGWVMSTRVPADQTGALMLLAASASGAAPPLGLCAAERISLAYSPCAGHGAAQGSRGGRRRMRCRAGAAAAGAARPGVWRRQQWRWRSCSCGWGCRAQGPAGACDGAGHRQCLSSLRRRQQLQQQQPPRAAHATGSSGRWRLAESCGLAAAGRWRSRRRQHAPVRGRCASSSERGSWQRAPG